MIALWLTVALAEPGPHGDADGCPACHLPAAESETGVGAPKPITATCLGCHPTADMHPVAVHPVDTTLPEGWPVDDQGLTCATCHVEPAHADVDDDLAAPWHREGPYPQTLGLCARCHDLQAFERVDPHHAASPVPREDPGCAACHTGLPEQGASVADARLRTAPEQLCDLCHEGPVHHGARTHVGAPLPASVSWPSLPGQRIACFTCHDVHEGGAVPTGRGLAAELRALSGLPPWTPDPEHPALLVTPLRRLCPTCHGEGP